MEYMPEINYSRLLDSANELVQNLKSRNINIPPGCSLLQSLDCLKQWLNNDKLPSEKYLMILRNSIGLGHLSILLNNSLNHNLIKNIEPHLRKLTERDPLFHYHYPRGYGRDLVFELFVASGLAPYVSDLTMSQSDTGEADLKFSFDNEEWCAECKILYEKPNSNGVDKQSAKVKKKLKKAIEQIEATKRDGIIILGLTQRIKHDVALKINGNTIIASPSDETVTAWYDQDLTRAMAEIGMASMSDQTIAELTDFMRHKKCIHTKGLFGFFHSICPVMQKTIISTMRPKGIFKMIAMGRFVKLSGDCQKAFSLAQCLNDSFRKILLDLT